MCPAFARAATAALVAVVIAGCSSPQNRAPVEDRGARSVPASTPVPDATKPAPDATKPPPGAENAGKPGYYAREAGRHIGPHRARERSELA